MEEILGKLEQWGYILLFIYSFGGGFVGLIAAGVLSALDSMNLYLSMLIACVGNITGSSLLSILARYQKKQLYELFKNHKRKITLAQILIKKYGFWLIFISKYIYGIKTFVPLGIGFSRYDMRKFFIINAIACVIWAIIIGLVGFYASSAVLKLLDSINANAYLAPLVLITLCVAIYVILRFFSKRIKKELI